jgi:polysaccharide export outer membrane protein
MRNITFYCIAILLFTSIQLKAQTSGVGGVNLTSLQNITGLNQLYSLLPQTLSASAMSSAGISPSQLNSVLGTKETEEEEDPLASEEAMYFINQLQGMLFDAVLDSVKEASGAEEDSIYTAEIFGHQFFRSKSIKVFTKSENVKATDSYTLDIGDEISISVYGSSVFNAKGEVNSEGYLEIENLSRIYVKGISFGAAKQLIINQLRKYINVGTSKTEIVLNYSRNITVHIVGDVVNPGSYVIPAINSVFNALSAADGPSRIGTIRNIQVNRNGKTIKTMDLYDFLLKGNITNDFFLQDGDYIYVPTQKVVAKIEGSIKRPWKYEMIEGETLEDLIQLAGGFTANAYTQSIQVKRFVNGKVELLDIDLAAFEGGKAFTIIDGDEFIIPVIPKDFENFVKVSGAVRFPGTYELKSGYRIADLIEAAGGLTFDAYLNRAYLIRKTEDLSSVIQNFHLGDVVLKNSSENVLLEKHDVIDVFSKREFLEEFKVSIEGAVLRSVSKDYAEGMTLNDLIFYSGGLKKEAANNVIEISRVVSTSEDGKETLARVIIKRVTVDGELEIDEASKNFPLSPMDQVFVRKNPDFDIQENITIRGEVAYPGDYPILQKDEKILDLIARAGGLTPYAFIPSAKLYRLDKTIGTVVIDLEEAFRSPDSRLNYILKDGDIIDIPTVNQLVSVSGAIGHPKLDSLATISSFYRPGRRAKYYIKKDAGGFDQYAKKRSTKVVNPDGSAGYTKKVLFFNRYPEVNEGATVSVEYKKKAKRVQQLDETPREPINWNMLLPSLIVGGTSVISSSILILVLK